MAKPAVDVQKMKGSAKEVSELLKILSHPERLMVLCQLTQGEMSAGLLQECSDLSPSAFSQHLSVLRKHNLVVVRKEAQQVFYSLAGDKTSEVIASLQALFCQ
ncbi:ArsR/SmtB family transcription factor [Vibrio salinus]|uniref:ArsR/SmtB family transcription factor n=1 Tax=Vibrio salinus TaxID=2899784 RepID=UPI001E3961EA|nr:metalloregulator ArsR/SmtB family transcription factor [Vibrio salinus]MCE0495385.1 metalloregulator ArsR/SmtB family transcription factor [Vibrio salinus]